MQVHPIPNEFLDNAFRLLDNADTAKKAAFEISGVTTGNTRVMTVPNSDTLIAAAANLLTACTSNAGTLDFSAAAKTLTVEDDAVVSQDYSTDADVVFAKVTTAEIEYSGNIALDAINAAANSTVAIQNSAATYVANLTVDGNITATTYGGSSVTETELAILDGLTATTAEFNTLTDNSMADTLHRHSELSASDGSPDAVVRVDSNGNVSLGIDGGEDVIYLSRYSDASGYVDLQAGTADENKGVGFSIRYRSSDGISRAGVYLSDTGVFSVAGNTVVDEATTNYVTLTDTSDADALHTHTGANLTDDIFLLNSGDISTGDISIVNNGNNPTLNLGDSLGGGNFGFIRWVSATDSINLGTTVGGTWNDQITLLESGNVGIGNNAPSTTLHVGAGTTIAADGTHNLVMDEGGADTGLGIYSTGTGYLRFGDAERNNAGGFSYVHSTDTLNLRTAAVDKVTIDSSGNVGIGTATPLSKLSINGGLHVGGDSDAGDNNLLVDDTVTAAKFAHDADTYIDKDGSNNMIFKDVNNDILTLSELSCPPMVDVSASIGSSANINTNIAGFADNVLIKWIEITTASTDWTLTVYGDDGFSSHAREVISNRSGNYRFFWDYPYEDEDGTSKFHYNFTSPAAATHTIRVLGFELR